MTLYILKQAILTQLFQKLMLAWLNKKIPGSEECSPNA